jgi:hypothetical protein
MSDIEFDILDELYFVKSWAELAELFAAVEFDLKVEVWRMLEKNWIRMIDGEEKEITLQEHDFMTQYAKFRFIATKKGLLAHNQV